MIGRKMRKQPFQRTMANDSGSIFVYDPYPSEFFFEKWINFDKYNEWLTDNKLVVFPIVGMYFITIFGLQRFMKDRQRLQLKTIAVIWNTLLAVFSLIGSIRFLQYMTLLLQYKNLKYTICEGQDLRYNQALIFWFACFTFSKVVELGDTLIIVLRKHPLTFLHVYHHTVTLAVGWLGLTEKNPGARWFPTVNYSVHAVMYAYFALTIYGFKSPKWVKMTITLVQILQMIGIAVIAIIAFNFRFSGYHCSFDTHMAILFLFVMLSFTFLFVRFFRNSYWKTDKQSTLKKKKM